MDYQIQLGNALAGSVTVTRNLADGADYHPDWRHLVFQQHLVQIAQAKDESAALEGALLKEPDHFIGQLLRYHFKRRCKIGRSLHYAVSCRRSEAANRVGSMIEAMVVAERTVEQIAAELGCACSHVIAYEKVYFDVRRYLNLRPVLKNFCYAGRDSGGSSRRWLLTAFERGWPALASIVSKSPPGKGPLGKHAVDALLRELLVRCLDMVKIREFEGVAPSEKDLVCLGRLMELLPKGDAPSRRLTELDYPKPLTREEEAKQKEAEEMVRKLTPKGRRLIRNLYDRVKVSAG